MDLTWEALREELNSSTLKGKRKRNERASSTPGLDGEEYMDQLEDGEQASISNGFVGLNHQLLSIYLASLLPFAR